MNFEIGFGSGLHTVLPGMLSCPPVGPLKAPAGVWSCFSGACCDGGLIRLTARTFSDNCATDSWRAFHLLTQLPVRDACSRLTGRRFNYQRPQLNHHQIPALDSPGSFPKLTNWFLTGSLGLARPFQKVLKTRSSINIIKRKTWYERKATHTLRRFWKPLSHLLDTLWLVQMFPFCCLGGT